MSATLVVGDDEGGIHGLMRYEVSFMLKSFEDGAWGKIMFSGALSIFCCFFLNANVPLNVDHKRSRYRINPPTSQSVTGW